MEAHSFIIMLNLDFEYLTENNLYRNFQPIMFIFHLLVSSLRSTVHYIFDFLIYGCSQ